MEEKEVCACESCPAHMEGEEAGVCSCDVDSMSCDDCDVCKASRAGVTSEEPAEAI